MALQTVCTEARGGMIRIPGGLEGRQMATGTVQGQTLVFITAGSLMATVASNPGMRPQ